MPGLGSPSTFRCLTVSRCWNPSLRLTGGEAFVEPDTEVNVIQPKEGVQSAVTFGLARAGLSLNYTLGESGLFSVSGAADVFSSLWSLQEWVWYAWFW